MALYNATNGPNWTNNTHWLSDRPLGEWYGVTTDGPGRVTALHLPGNQLIGEMPKELGSLSNLQVLYLSSNQLSGEIPEELGGLSTLRGLYLSNNRLSGEIPEELGNLSDLGTLGLSSNRLSGEIPEELGSLSNLKELDLYSNHLSGEIPEELGKLSDLEVLRLDVNRLSGEIPPELGSLSRLQELYLFDNQLSGAIPAELGSLSRLQRLTLSRNQLSGEIPVALSLLSNLEFLSLIDNQLSGDIPEEFGTLPNLRWLWLSNNRLTGGIPAELGGLPYLEQLELSGNQLSGCIPRSLRDVVGNDPSDVGLLFCMPAQSDDPDRVALIALYNSAGGPSWTNNDNWLSDAPIGKWYGVTTDDTGRVIILDLMENQLSGEIPEELVGLSNLELLTLSGNQLSGCIPARLRGVEGNDLSDLGLPVCTPVESIEWDRAALVAFYRATGGPNWTESYNWLVVSPISWWFGVETDYAGRVTRLERIGNDLSGWIPPELGSLFYLEELRLWDNQLVGDFLQSSAIYPTWYFCPLTTTSWTGRYRRSSAAYPT